MSRKTELALLAAIVLVAAVFRLGSLGLMEFKGDEAQALLLALPIQDGGAWPEVGLMSSVGLNNPPLFVYLCAIPMAFTTDPVAVTGSLVGLLGVLAVLLTYVVIRPRFGAFAALGAAALFACSPWAVLYARKVWAQDVLPIFSVVLLHALFAIVERTKTWLAAAVPVLLCALWQIHFSAFALMAVAGVVLLWRAREVRWTAVLAGTAVAVAMLIPYGHYQTTHAWEDVVRLKHIAAGRRPDGTVRTEKGKLNLDPVRDTALVSGGTVLDYALGPSTDTWREEQSGFGRGARSAGGWLAMLAIGAGLGVVVWRTLRGARLVRRFPWLELSPTGGPWLVLSLWMLGVLGFFIAARLEHTFPHYYIIAYPVPFVLGALALSELRRWRVGAWVAVGLLVAVTAAHASSLLTFRGFLVRHGGAVGDYGVVYQHKADLARWASRNGLELKSGPWELRYLIDQERAYGDVGGDVDPAPAGTKHVDVHDALRWPPARDLRCDGRKHFGPLVACPRP